MILPPFHLEQYLAKYEFTAPYVLCCSDAQSYSVQELLRFASPEKLALWQNLELGYTYTTGHPELRSLIAQQCYPGLSAENIVCFAGAQEGIFASLFALCKPQDHVIVLTPCYQSLQEMPLLKQATVNTVELTPQNQWRIDIDCIKQAIQENTRMIIINFPHNPTGQVISQEELTCLIALCQKNKIILFSDEVYYGLGNPEKGWAQPAACAYQNAISVGVMSKAFGLAGLRIGWIACQNKELLDQIEHTKNYLSICNSAPSEILSMIALENKDALLERNNKIVQHNLTLLEAFFKRHSDLFSWVRPQGGCTGFVEYKGEQTVETFCKTVIEKTGVLLLPATVYSYTGQYFRIGFGRNNMKEALDIFEQYLQHLKTTRA